MSRESKDLRSRAFRELRASRNGGSKNQKADNVKRAAAYKALSENEEWLSGEKARPRKSGKKPGQDDLGFPPDDESKFG
jgi:hypothetical protein